MFVSSFECPSCGGNIERKSGASKALYCPYCGQTSFINASTLEEAGEKHTLIDYGSSLAVGKEFSFQGRKGQILGRIRIDYDDGFWDEWFVQFLDNGEEAWIQEDDGSFVLFRLEKSLKTAPNLATIKVGGYDNFYDHWENVFITSKSKATVNGGEGELPFRIIPGDPADFAEGIWNGKIVSVELLPNDYQLFVGTPFQLEELQLQ